VRELLRIAVPKGRLQPKVLALFRAAGFATPQEEDLRSRRLVFEKDGIEWIFVKDGDVPVYVEFGAADCGIAGLDQLLEQQSDVYQPLQLPFGFCRMMLIGAPGVESIDSSFEGKIASKYPNVTREFLRSRSVRAEVVMLQGSVELAAVLNLAPYIVDLVETGETIRVHHLQPLETIHEIAPRLIVNKTTYRLQSKRLADLIDRLEVVTNEGVLR
jgi:ATP phosphoribosyltransferase